MEDLIKNIFFAGIGSLALTYDKSKEIINQLIDMGKISVEQGRELNEELKQVVKKEGQDEKERILEDLNLATKDDIANIMERLDRIEARDGK